MMEYAHSERTVNEALSDKPMNYEISFHLSAELKGRISSWADSQRIEKGELLSAAFRDFIGGLGIDVSKDSLTSTISVLKFSERMFSFLNENDLSHILVRQVFRRRGPLVTFYTDEATYHGMDRLFLMFRVPVNKDALVEIMLLSYLKRNGGEIIG